MRYLSFDPAASSAACSRGDKLAAAASATLPPVTFRRAERREICGFMDDNIVRRANKGTDNFRVSEAGQLRQMFKVPVARQQHQVIMQACQREPLRLTEVVDADQKSPLGDELGRDLPVGTAEGQTQKSGSIRPPVSYRFNRDTRGVDVKHIQSDAVASYRMLE